mgnify:CR=1 FL=1
MTEERNTAAPETEESRNFILNLIDQDIAEGGQFQGQTVHTRFPPEPNGYLHIGHCKALCIDFGTAEKFGGLCNLRMDDTNPAKEDTEYVDAIQQDIHWLGFDWGDRFFYGSDYFEKDYEYAVELIKKGLAYVCELTPEEFKANRGDIGIPATSPYRDRPIEENLRLFEKMKMQGWAWSCCPMGHAVGGSGLYLRCRDMAKFGAAVHDLKKQGCDMAVLGCTELSLVKRDEHLGKFFIDSTEVLCRHALEACGVEPVGF